MSQTEEKDDKLVAVRHFPDDAIFSWQIFMPHKHTHTLVLSLSVLRRSVVRFNRGKGMYVCALMSAKHAVLRASSSSSSACPQDRKWQSIHLSQVGEVGEGLFSVPTATKGPATDGLAGFTGGR